MNKINLFTYSHIIMLCFFIPSHAMKIVPLNDQTNLEKSHIFSASNFASDTPLTYASYITSKAEKDNLLDSYKKHKNTLCLTAREEQISTLITRNRFLFNKLNDIQIKKYEKGISKKIEQKKLTKEFAYLQTLKQELFIDAKNIIESSAILQKKPNTITEDQYNKCKKRWKTAIKFLAARCENQEVKELIKEIEPGRNIINLFIINSCAIPKDNIVHDLLDNFNTLATINSEFRPLTEEEIENRKPNKKPSYETPYNDTIDYYNRIDEMFWRSADKDNNCQIKKTIIDYLLYQKNKSNLKINQVLQHSFKDKAPSLITYITTIIEPNLAKEIKTRDILESLDLDGLSKNEVKPEDLPKTLLVNHNDSTINEHKDTFNGQLKNKFTTLKEYNDKQAYEAVEKDFKTISDNKLNNLHNHNIKMNFDQWKQKNSWQQFLWTKKPAFLLAAIKTKVSSFLSWFKFW